MNKFLILTGPSAVGKSTVISHILKDNRFYLSVSHTTRAPRPHEVNGVDYVFVSREDFELMLSKGLFLEKTIFSGNYYGTSISEESRDKITVFDVDIRGYHFFKEHYSQSYFCLLTAERAVVEARLMKRIRVENQGTTEKEIEERLKSFEMFKEISNLDCFNSIIDNSGSMKDISKNVDDLIKNSIEYLNLN
ncbi:guanylate kinase [Pancytospora epiphaga]|nr:guanylate kinase [Pancytospora epiphaga]